MTNLTALTPNYSNVKSFYNKAKVINEDRFIKLQSYDTIVAIINKNKKTVKVIGWFSSATARHINEFLLQNGFTPLTKKQMIESPTLNLLK